MKSEDIVDAGVLGGVNTAADLKKATRNLMKAVFTDAKLSRCSITAKAGCEREALDTRQVSMIIGK